MKTMKISLFSLQLLAACTIWSLHIRRNFLKVETKHNRIRCFMVPALDSRHAIQAHHFFMSSIRYQHQVINLWYKVQIDLIWNTFNLLNWNKNLDQPVPHAASCTISENGLDAYFAVANQMNVILYTMNCANGQVTHIELKENYIVPRILTNITEAFRYFCSFTSALLYLSCNSIFDKWIKN